MIPFGSLDLTLTYMINEIVWVYLESINPIYMSLSSTNKSEK